MEQLNWFYEPCGTSRSLARFQSTTMILCIALGIAFGSSATAQPVRSLDLPVVANGKVGYSLLDSATTGIRFHGSQALRKHRHTQFVDNAGLAAGDVDGDGRVDLFFCGMATTNALYRNLGNWKFEDITVSAGFTHADPRSSGAAFADVDGDGDLDLVVVSLGKDNALYLNDGKGRFKESNGISWRKAKAAGDTSAALADVDGDGDLDLFTTSYLNTITQDKLSLPEFDVKAEPELQKIMAGLKPSPEFLAKYTVFTNQVAGKMVLTVEENGYPSVLYLNDGKGNFKAVTDADRRFSDENGRAIPMPADWSLAAQFRDVNGDRAPDLYVCNDFWTPDRFWINDGTGRFRLISKTALRRTSSSSMGVDFADINHDGHLDLMTVDMLSRDHTRRKTQMGAMQPSPFTIGLIENRPQIMQNTLFLNRGDGTFAEIAQYAGVKASEWSWATAFLDVDLDGNQDLLITTGMVRDYMDADTQNKIAKMGELTPEQFVARESMFPVLATQNFIFRNKGNLQFEDVSSQWGFRTESVSGGLAFADFDNDGDLDVVINNTEKSPEVYRCDSGAARVAVRLKGKAPNTAGIGAKIQLFGGAVPTQETEVIAGGIYASGCDALRVFAAGNSRSDMKLEVTWRDGKRTVVNGVMANRVYEIEEGGAQPVPRSRPVSPESYFVDESFRIEHFHIERPFDDFVRQPLLPNRVSQFGPGLAWLDIDGDNDEDLVIGSGGGGKVALFRNEGEGPFRGYDTVPMMDDAHGVVGWSARGGNPARLSIAVSNHEAASEVTPSVISYDVGSIAQWKVAGRLEGNRSTAGALSLGDLDGDGDLDLFVGGRAVPGRYPEPADSRLFRLSEGKWQLDSENSALLKGIGLVSASVMGDVDADGDCDLVLACEWGSLRVYTNDGGRLKESTRELGLSGYTGWWNGVNLGDIDGDGHLDIVASNWGRNSKYEYSYSVVEPLKVYYGDFDGNGSLDIVEAHFDKRMGKVVPERGLSCSSRAMPFIRERTPTYLAFGSCGLEDIYGDKLKGAKLAEANTLDHTVFLRRDNVFKARVLPAESQLAPAFGVNVGDYDGDGAEDVFLSQNFFAVQVETPRNDGGRGLWLRGDGAGNLTPVSGQESGIKVYGEQRGSALCDFDGDGRVDLVVSQNGSQTKLFRNRKGTPGLRVRLEGNDSNPGAIGAVMRLAYAGGKMGPARPVLAGSGYWSQDSSVQVLGKGGPVEGLYVRWPGGKETRVKVPPAAQEVSVNLQGNLTVVK